MGCLHIYISIHPYTYLALYPDNTHIPRNDKYIKLLQLSTKWLHLIYKFTPIYSLCYTQNYILLHTHRFDILFCVRLSQLDRWRYYGNNVCNVPITLLDAELKTFIHTSNTIHIILYTFILFAPTGLILVGKTLTKRTPFSPIWGEY